MHLQQAAVNTIMERLRHASGLMAVNGPPGTGKTTLLRDIIAANLVDRALAMATFTDPCQAFTPTNEKLQFTEKAYAIFHTLAPQLRGYEMLVASSNNRAVENISRELPMADAIGGDTELAYFKSVSDALQGSSGTTWGLIAAVLGNSKNRAQFVNTFWRHKEWGFLQYLKGARGRPASLDVMDPATNQVIGQRPPYVVAAEEPPTPQQAQRRWQKARRRLIDLHHQVEQELARIEGIREQCRAFTAAQQNIAALQRDVDAATDHQYEQKSVASSSQQICDIAQLLVKRYEEAARRHKASRPNFFARLFRTARSCTWAMIDAPIQDALRQATDQLITAQQAVVGARLSLHVAEIEKYRAEQRLETPKRKLAALAAALEGPRQELGDRVMDGNKSSGDHDTWHLTAPWIPDSVHQKREALFVAAMAVHRSFLDVAAQPMQHNLHFAMEVLSGRDMSSASQRAMLPHVWSSLFLVVPVLSTTFASVARTLKYMPDESLGWLLIDEAGQATPQSAVGALLRCKRAVVVGDPLQVPPVVSLPEKLVTGICKTYGDLSPGLWAAPEASVQTLADRACAVQAEFSTESGKPRRVGMPLLVHRRCQDPMGRISNNIAYDGQMVLAPGKFDLGDIGRVWGKSCWFDVESTSEEKWSREEGDLVVDLTARLQSGGVEAPDLFIITPFRVVSQQLQSLARFGQIVLPNHKDRIGTIHTFQGREAHSVLLVLGAPGPQCRGARNWAAGTPNILNVAVSRARQNLYVVGSRAAWALTGHASHFKRYR